jgi:hypothetical protein
MEDIKPRRFEMRSQGFKERYTKSVEVFELTVLLESVVV